MERMRAALTDKVFTPATESSHRWPVFLPDGDHFLFWAGDFNERPDDHTSGIYHGFAERPAAKAPGDIGLVESRLRQESAVLRGLQGRAGRRCAIDPRRGQGGRQAADRGRPGRTSSVHLLGRLQRGPERYGGLSSGTGLVAIATHLV